MDGDSVICTDCFYDPVNRRQSSLEQRLQHAAAAAAPFLLLNHNQNCHSFS